MGKGGGKIEVTDYHMSMHQGFCWGPVDALLGIYVGEKAAWEDEIGGDEPVTFSVTQNDLFGGNRKEGGVAGTITYLPGFDDQILPDSVAALLGGTSTTVPGFRGVASLFFHGSFNQGFMWSSNTPYLKPLWGKFRRSPKGLNAAYRMIGNQVEVSITGFAATVDGVSGTLTNGVVSTIGGHGIAVNYNGGNPTAYNRTVTVDGVDIVIERDDGIYTVTVGSEERADVRPGTTVSIYGMSITVSNTSTQVSFGAAGVDANPVHMIYECLTNTDWGMGASSNIINVASFQASPGMEPATVTSAVRAAVSGRSNAPPQT